MSYIGVQSQNQVSPAFHREVVTPDGSASFFDLVQDVPGYNADNVLVVVNNVVQHPFDSYTIKADANGNPRRLDFAGTVPASTDVIYVTHRGVGTLNITPAAGTVDSVALADNLRSGNVDSFAGSAHSVVSSNSTFTLSEIPLNSDSISVFVNGIYQKPTTNYSVTGSSAVLTFSGQVVSTDEIDVHHHTIRTGVVHVADGSVTSTKIVDDAVGAAAIADGAIDAAAKIADDVITGAKFANDIAISTTGNIATTGSGTLTVAGATNLASVATGTLSSAVVFPAGHVIQTKYATDGTHFTLASHNSMTEISTDFRITITPKSTSNKLIMQFHMPVSDGGTTALWNFQFYDVTGTDIPEPKSASQISGHEEGWGHRGSHSDVNDHDVVRGFFIANVPRTTATVYTIRAKNDDGNGTMKVNYSATNTSWGWQGVTTFMVQEIQG